VSSEPYSATVHRAWAADLDPVTLYALLRLRVDVFVVEQQTAFPELDGRDLTGLPLRERTRTDTEQQQQGQYSATGCHAVNLFAAGAGPRSRQRT